MTRPIPIILILLLTYIVAPPLLNWITAPTGAWYKPFLIWLIVVVVAFVVQARSGQDDA